MITITLLVITNKNPRSNVENTPSLYYRSIHISMRSRSSPPTVARVTQVYSLGDNSNNRKWMCENVQFFEIKPHIGSIHVPGIKTKIDHEIFTNRFAEREIERLKFEEMLSTAWLRRVLILYSLEVIGSKGVTRRLKRSHDGERGRVSIEEWSILAQSIWNGFPNWFLKDMGVMSLREGNLILINILGGELRKTSRLTKTRY